jgi:Fe-S-cluster-containing hydrogenase component 2
MIKIDYNKCSFKNGQYINRVGGVNRKCCVEVCPTHALSRAEVIKVDNSKCRDCGLCLKVCPNGAITMI